MPEVPDLSLGGAQARSAPVEPAPADEAPKLIEAHTAIMIFTTTAGEVVLTTDINLPLAITRDASRDEAYGMCAVALKDMAVSETAVNSAAQTVQASIAHNARMQRAMQDQQLQAHLQQQGGLGQPGGRG